MREITIQELEVVGGGVPPLIAAGLVVLGKAAVGAAGGSLGYLTTNSILGDQPTAQGALSAAGTGALTTTFGPVSPHIMRISLTGGVAGGLAGRAVSDGSDYPDGTDYCYRGQMKNSRNLGLAIYLINAGLVAGAALSYEMRTGAL